MEAKQITSNHNLNGSTGMKGSVQGVLQNVQAWEKDGINNFQRLYDTQHKWLITAVSSFAEKFALHISNQPLSSIAAPSLPSPSFPAITAPTSDILPSSLSLSSSTYHSSKMKPDKKPQLKLYAMDFTQVGDDVDDEMPTVRSKTAATLQPQDSRKRLSNTKEEIEPVHKRTSRPNDQGQPVYLHLDRENRNPLSNIRDTKSPVTRKTSLRDLIAEPPVELDALLSGFSARRVSGSRVCHDPEATRTASVAAGLPKRAITTSNGSAHDDAFSSKNSRISTQSSSFLPKETETYGSSESAIDIPSKAGTLPTTRPSNIVSQSLPNKQITRPRKSSTSFPSKREASPRKSSFGLGSPGNSSVDEEPGVDPYAVEVPVLAKARPLATIPSFGTIDQGLSLLEDEPGIDPYAPATKGPTPSTTSRAGRVDPSPRLLPAKRTQDSSPPLQAVSSLSSTSLPSPRDNVSALEKQKQTEKVAEMRKRYLESSQLQQSKMQEARKIASLHPESGVVEDPLEPGLVSPASSALPSTNSQTLQRRFSFSSSPSSLPVSPLASSQPIGFVSPQFSPISHIAESPVIASSDTLGTKRTLTKPSQAVTRAEKARDEKAREEKLKEAAEKKQKATKDELAKQRRAEAERKRKLLEEEDLKKKQIKAEERQKKLETYEKKRNQQHQEQKKIKEDKRTTVKEKAEVLKKPLKEEIKEESKKTAKAPIAGTKRPILQPVAQNDGLMSPPPNRPPRTRKSPDNPFQQLTKKRVVNSPKQNHDEDNYEMSDFRDDDDDEDSDEPKKPIPAWAKGTMLSKALEAQYLDPDEIFHPIEAQACDLTAIFENFRKKKRFNHRSSSGNWLHDRLHWKEEQSYKLKMGFGLPRA